MSNKVVHCTTVHSPRDNRILRKECSALARAGHDVTLVAPAPQNFTEFGVAVKCIKPRSRRVSRMLLGPLDVLCAVAAVRPRIVHAHDPELIPALILIRAVLRRTRIVFDAHEDLPAQVTSKPYIPSYARRAAWVFAKGLEWIAARVAHHIIAATPSIAANFPANKTSVVQNFPLLEDYPEVGGEPTHTAVYVGALTEIRGGNQLFDSLKQSATGVRCVMAGPIQPSISKRADDCDKFDYLGRVPAEQVPSVIGRGKAGIVCFLPYPNHTEAQPNKLFEYMAAGRAVICSDFPLWRVLLEPLKCALFVDPSDPEQLKDAMEYIEANPGTAEEMGRRARSAFSSKFVFDKEVPALLSAYERLLA